ncbi:hypothetical protein SAMN04488066_12424 [Halorubrum aquaticum]|uniref:Uncharacterized protein n=1 Tax=Halorubrum aquaticum TaxID=387340 RepID=A0A1I3CL21_9EURY|nr:hypothetical protein [Halorubrum aquaticum]SFH75182.1 hypothetical protein SAMN04488066_12424 [Halorubrum aquaticum]
MSLAAATRETVREHPFLLDALRAGTLNYSATAAWLVERGGLDGDADAVATALRRFREDLPAYATADRTASVTMRSGVGVVTDAEADGVGEGVDGEPLLRVGGAAVVSEGSHTALLATGGVDAAALSAALRRLDAVDVAVAAAGVAVGGGDDGSLVVIVDRRDGATALRVVEDALAAVPGVDGE